MSRYRFLILVTVGILMLCCLGCSRDKKKTEKAEVSVMQDTESETEEKSLPMEGSETSVKQKKEKQKEDRSVPAIASNFLSDVGLPTKGYKYDGFSSINPYGSASDYQEIGSDSPLANNIAYYVSGSENEARELKLVLNVNVPSKSEQAHATLLKYSGILYQKALGKELPSDIKTSITKGESGQWESGNTLVKLVRDNWPTGRGYELRFTIEQVEAKSD